MPENGRRQDADVPSRLVEGDRPYDGPVRAASRWGFALLGLVPMLP